MKLDVGVSKHAVEQLIDRCVHTRMKACERADYQDVSGYGPNDEVRVVLSKEEKDQLRLLMSQAVIAEIEEKRNYPPPSLGGGPYAYLAVVPAIGAMREKAYLVVDKDTKYETDWIVCTALNEETFQARREKAQQDMKKPQAEPEIDIESVIERGDLVLKYKNGRKRLEAFSDKRALRERVNTLLVEGIDKETVKVYGPMSVSFREVMDL